MHFENSHPIYKIEIMFALYTQTNENITTINDVWCSKYDNQSGLE